MGNVKKAKFEQRMVLVLLVVFAACFVQMLRRLGFIGSTTRPAPVVATPAGAPAPAAAPAAVQAVEQYRARMEAVETLELGRVVRPPEPSAPPAAMASEPLPRDPLTSLLPSESPASPTTPLKGKGAATATGAAASSEGRGGAAGGTGQTEVAPPPLTVRGVIVGGEHPQALIDEGVYGIGDLVKGVRIIAIERDGVLVMTPGGVYRLSPDAGAVLVKREVSP